MVRLARPGEHKSRPVIHRFEISGGLLVANLAGQRIVLDTGSPVSFSRLGSVLFGGRVHRNANSSWAGDADWLSNLAESKLDGLVGCDVLQDYRFMIDRGAGEIAVIGPTEMGKAAIGLPFDRATGVPVISARVNGLPTRVVLDTGAACCFTTAKLLAGVAECDSRIEVRHPSHGPSMTKIYIASLAIGGEAAVSIPEHPFALVAPELEATMTGFGIGGIIGLDVILEDQLVFDFGRNTVSWSIAA